MSTTPDYGEPWRVVPLADGGIASRDGSPIIDRLGQSHRAISCVNACQGMVDPAAEIEAMREAIRETASHLSGFLGFHSDALSLDQVRALSATLDKIKPFIPDATPSKP